MLIFYIVQEYHFGSREWNIIETSGYPVKGGYGHSAVLDELTNKIYVYGGYVSSSSNAAQLTSSLYSFDHLAARWGSSPFLQALGTPPIIAVIPDPK